VIAGDDRRRREDDFDSTLRNLVLKVKENFFSISGLQEVPDATARIKEKGEKREIDEIYPPT
jgi:hypothetical protein